MPNDLTPIRNISYGELMGPEDEVRYAIVTKFASLRAEEGTVPAGTTLLEIADRVIPAGNVSRPLLRLWVGGIEYPPATWASVRPKPRTFVSGRVVPRGGGKKKGKSPMRFLLSIVIMVAAIVASVLTMGALSPIVGTLAATAIGALAGAAVSIGGQLLLNAIAPLKPPKGGKLSGNTANDQQSQSYMLTGVANSFTPFGVVPLPLGRMRMYPNKAALTFTETAGDDQYLRALFVWGYGPLHIDLDSLKIGETPLSSYEGVEIEHVYGYPDDPPLSLFPIDIYEEPMSVEINNDGIHVPSVEATTTATFAGQPSNGQSISVAWRTYTFKTSLTATAYEVKIGANTSETVDNMLAAFNRWEGEEVKYSKGTKANAWASAKRGTGNTIIFTALKDGGYEGAKGNSIPCTSEAPNITFPDTTFNDGVDAEKITDADPLEPNEKWTSRISQPNADELSIDFSFIRGLADYNGSSAALYEVTMQVRYRPVGGDDSSWVLFPDLTYSEKTTEQIRRTKRWTTPARGQYEIQVRKKTIDNTTDRVFDEVYLTAIRTFTNESPVNEPGLAMTAMRIKATKELNGDIQQLNGIVTSKGKSWNPETETWDADQLITNNADICIRVLQGYGNYEPLDDDEIDWDGFADFWQWCDDNGFKFNMIRDFESNVWDTLTDVMSSALAAPALNEDLWSVIIDRAKSVVSQHFTPRNSWNFSGDKGYIDKMPHALRIRFKNEQKGFNQDERIVPDEGYDETTAETFDSSVEFPGVTDPDLIYKLGRRRIAEARLRPETYTFYANVEGLTCRRGSLVMAYYDIPAWGYNFGRVKAVETDGSGNVVAATLDDIVAMEPDKEYSCRFRRSNGDTVLVKVLTDPGEKTHVVFEVPIPADQAIAKDNLFMAGVGNQVGVPVLIKNMQIQNNYYCKITVIDYALDLFPDLNGPIPPFNSHVQPTPGNRYPIISNVQSDEGVMLRNNDGSLLSRMLLTFSLLSYRSANINQVEIQARPTGGGEDTWLTRGLIRPGDRNLSITGVDDGATYDLRGRFYFNGVPGMWSPITTHTVIGKTTPPPGVPTFRLDDQKLTWTYPNPPIDIAGFVIRYARGNISTITWNSMTEAHPDVWRDSPFALGNSWRGVVTFAIRAIDVAGNLSNETAYIFADFGEGPVDYFDANTYDLAVNGFPGTITNGLVVGDGTDLEADVEPDLFWGSDDSLFWPVDNTELFWGTIYKQLEYIFSYTPPFELIEGLNSLVIDMSPALDAPHTIEYRGGSTELFWGADGDLFWGPDDEALFWPETDQDWMPFPGRLHTIQYTRYEFKLTVPSNIYPTVIDEMKVRYQMRALEDTIPDLLVLSTGTRIPLTKSFYEIRVVNPTIQDTGTGATRVKILDYDADLGPLCIGWDDTTGTAVDALTDFIVKGW